MKEWQGQISASREFDSLVLIFSKELNSLQSRQAQERTASRAQDAHITFLIQHLLMSRVTEDEELDPIRLKHSVSGMRVLLAMLDKVADGESKAEKKKKVRRRLQCALSKLGATQVALSMAASENDELCEAGLRLAVGLLRGGNTEVQDAIFGLINSELAEVDVHAFDGTENTLVLMMKRRLRIAVAEVREAKMYRCQQKDRLKELELDELHSALSPATVAAMRAELNKEFASRSHVEHVLLFLQLLCEGHHTELQDFIRDQRTEMSSVDLVREVTDLLLTIEPELDAHNVRHAQLCVEALTEFVQGNISHQNAEVLLETKLVESLDRLMQTPIEGVPVEDVSGLKWSKTGTKPPANGTELRNEKLSIALESKAEFTEHEWRQFRISELTTTHFIRSGGKYFQPAEGSEPIEGAPSFNEVRSSIVALLMAILEGSDQSVERRMMMRLDLVPLAKMCGDLWKEALKAAAKEPREERRHMNATDEEEGVEGVRRASSPKQGELIKGLASVKAMITKRAWMAAQASTIARPHKLTKQGHIKGLAAFRDTSVAAVEQASDMAAGIAANAGALLELPLQFTRAGSPQATALDAGFSLYVLLKYLLKFQQDPTSLEDEEEQQEEVGETVLEVMLKPAHDFYDKYVGSVEILNAEAELERVFFRFPYYCRSLTPERRHRLVWTELDRETPGAQLQDFIEAADELQFQMKHEEWLNGIRLWSLLMRHKRKAFGSMFGLALVVNLSLIVRSSLCIDHEGNSLAWSDLFCSKGSRDAVISWEEQRRGGGIINVTAIEDSDSYFSVSSGGRATDGERAFAVALQVIVFVLGKFMALSSAMIFVLNAVEHGVPRIRRNSLRRTGNRQTWSEIIKRVRRISPNWDDFWFKLFFYASAPLDFLWDARLAYYSLSFWCCAVMSSLFSPYFLCIGLLDLFRMDQSLQDVGTAIGSNAEKVFIMFLFMLVIIYIYAIMAYLALAEHFVLGGTVPVCTSLWQCLIATADDSLRANDVGAVIMPYTTPDLATLISRDDPDRGDETFRYYFQHLFAFTFWLIVVIIMLNAVFGIMIDSFGELRAERKEIKRKNETECFICGIGRFLLDTKGGGFERHIEKDHNMWNYLFLIMAIREKDETQYNGWEQHVAKKLAAKDTSFLPRDALSLQSVKLSELAEEQAEREQATKMATSIAELTNEQKSIKQAILALQESMQSLAEVRADSTMLA
mmetsp:Transcript_44835/g.118388  ORF Transcript_44835/g.118388 Transcript_44835/m.118388 type:complete len:1208 (+) Transcript_44835:1-3624(+)